MMNSKPSKAAEKAWMQRVAARGCIISRQTFNIQLHHCVGREGKQNKYHIGRWFILPISFWMHDVSSDDPLNITHHRKDFVNHFGKESELFRTMCLEMKEPLPFGEDVLDAIMATNR